MVHIALLEALIDGNFSVQMGKSASNANLSLEIARLIASGLTMMSSMCLPL